MDVRAERGEAARQLHRIEGARVAAPRAGRADREPAQELAELLRGFVRGHAHEQVDAAPRAELEERLAQRRHRLRVVRAVQQHERLVAHDLEPPGPLDTGQPTLHEPVGDARAGQRLHGAGRQRRVERLMAADERQLQRLIDPAQAGEDELQAVEGVLRNRGRQVASGGPERHAPLLAGRTQHRSHAVLLGSCERHLAGLEDLRLLPSDARRVSAQDVSVIHVDRPEDGDRLVDHVDRIQPPPHPDFQHGDLHLPPGEMDEGGGGQRFKVRGRRLGRLAPARLQGRAELRDGRRERLLADPIVSRRSLGGLAPLRSSDPPGRPDPDALAQILQVGGGVEPCAQPALPQHGVHHGGDRALPVGAGDHHRAEPALRIPQPLAEPPHARQLHLAHGLWQMEALVIHERIQIADRLFVRHHRCLMGCRSSAPPTAAGACATAPGCAAGPPRPTGRPAPRRAAAARTARRPPARSPGRSSRPRPPRAGR